MHFVSKHPKTISSSIGLAAFLRGRKQRKKFKAVCSEAFAYGCIASISAISCGLAGIPWRDNLPTLSKGFESTRDSHTNTEIAHQCFDRSEPLYFTSRCPVLILVYTKIPQLALRAREGPGSLGLFGQPKISIHC